MSFLNFCTKTVKGLPQLSPAQRVYIRVVFDREQPQDLDEAGREIARQLFGDVDTVPDVARHVVCVHKGARVGGTLLHSVFLLYAGLTFPLDGLAVGEVGFGAVVAPDLRLAGQAFRYALGVAESTLSIASSIVSKTGSSLTLRRQHDGKLVTIECLPASRGGSALRGRSYFAALLDESAFFRDETSGQVNDAELYRAVATRIIPGGLLSIISTVWADMGLLWEKVKAELGKPQTCLAVEARSLVMRTDERMKQIVAEEYERDPANAAREFDLQPLGAGAGAFFASSSVSDAVDQRLQTPLLRGSNARIGAGVDLALVSDSSALVVSQLDNNVVTVLHVLELRPERGRPLKLSEVSRSFGETVKRFGTTRMMGDHHLIESAREYLSPMGVYLTAAPGSLQGKLDTYLLVRKLLTEGRIRVPANEKRLIQQLKEVRSKATSGGNISITSPRKAGHGDVLSAFILSVWSLLGDSGAELFLSAMRASAEREKAGKGVLSQNFTHDWRD